MTIESTGVKCPDCGALLYHQSTQYSGPMFLCMSCGFRVKSWKDPAWYADLARGHTSQRTVLYNPYMYGGRSMRSLKREG